MLGGISFESRKASIRLVRSASAWRMSWQAKPMQPFVGIRLTAIPTYAGCVPEEIVIREA